MYDPSGLTKDLRERAPMLLGLWHPVKQLMCLIWYRYLHVVWAPLLHFIQPDARIFVKPNTSRLHDMLGYMRLAYDAFSGNLDDAIGVLRRHQLQEGRFVWLLNIRDLCQFFIPLVFLLPRHIFFHLILNNMEKTNCNVISNKCRSLLLLY
jgi:hypothetical protein